jgi:hypothetical protein
MVLGRQNSLSLEDSRCEGRQRCHLVSRVQVRVSGWCNIYAVYTRYVNFYHRSTPMGALVESQEEHYP